LVGACHTQIADKAAEAVGQVSHSPFWQELTKEILAPETLAGRAASVLVIVLVSVAAYWLVLLIIGRARRKLLQTARTLEGLPQLRILRAATVLSIVGSGVKWVIALVALIWIMSVLGIPVIPLLTAGS